VSRHLRIKICGITNAEDAVLAAELGADAIGLNYHPDSPRSIDPTQAPAILQELPLFTQAVGVFVNRRLHEIADTLQPLSRIWTMQWHGDVEQREVGALAPFALIAAFSVRDASSLEAISRYLDGCRAVGQMPAAILVDAHVLGQHGGTGQKAPWSLLADFRPGIPLILAGGLTPENVSAAIRIVRPYAVDVASGVEENPRRKDADKMRRFIANAREAQSTLRD